MTITNPLLRHSLQFGVVLGVTISLIELITLFLGIINQPFMQIVNISIVVSMLVIALRKFRDQVQNGILSFGEGFQLSFFICIFSGVVWAVFRYIEYSLTPSLLDDMMIMLEDTLIDRNMPENQIEAMMELYKMGLTPVSIAFITLIFNMGFGGSILSLALAAAFKREEKII